VNCRVDLTVLHRLGRISAGRAATERSSKSGIVCGRGLLARCWLTSVLRIVRSR
jgi:hypothetical protein